MTAEGERIAALERDNVYTTKQLTDISNKLEALPGKIEKIVSESIEQCRSSRPSNKDDHNSPNYAGRVGWSLALCQGIWIFAKSKGWL